MKNLTKKIVVFFTAIFLSISLGSVSFADGHGKKILFSIKGPGSGNPFWASVTKGAEEEAKKLRNTFGVLVDFFPCDLTDEKAPQALYDFCNKKGYVVDLLVNNAGYAIPTSFDQTSMIEEEKFIRVLGISVIALCKLFIIDMLKRKQGRIMIVSSVAAFAPPSSIQALYGPIKTFMNRFSEGLNRNYNHLGITSTAVCPGYTITNFHTAS